MSVGVRPENKLAVDAGLEIGKRGGIRVNDHMQTSDADVYAVGDAIEIKHFIDGSPTQIPLGGPANRQGRIAADNIFGRSSTYRGTQGTAIVGVFDMTAAMTGFSEKVSAGERNAVSKDLRASRPTRRLLSRRREMSIKLLFAPSRWQDSWCASRRSAGVDKRIDVFAVAIQAGMTVYDLEEMELAYAPAVRLGERSR